VSDIDEMIAAVEDRADDYTWPLLVVESARAELAAMREEIARLKADLDRAQAFMADISIGLNAARKSAESIGDGVSRSWDVSLLLAAAERCAAYRSAP
jgi:hypothetical protein